MKAENVFLFAGLFFLVLVFALLQKVLSDRYLMKMTKALENKDYEAFEKMASSFFVRLLYSPFNLQYLKLNEAFLKEDKEYTDEIIRGFELIDMNAMQKEDVLLRIFNYYMAEEN